MFYVNPLGQLILRDKWMPDKQFLVLGVCALLNGDLHFIVRRLVE